ncbi:MAG: T9SS type A sorting domain-containing protein [Bacteroidetes bacterium]|nr:T9SS type A sorting domain-containing protein [Bacteroidota bacterium]
MKKHLLFLILTSCIFLDLSAQGPTLTSSNSTFKSGETFFSQSVYTTGVSELSGGANQTWDYSSVIDSGAINGIAAVTPASTPFADSFPTSNLAIKSLNDSLFIYYNSQSSALYQLGLTTKDSFTLRCLTPKIYLPYPFSYNSFFTDSVVEEITNTGFIIRGKDTLTADGYGTLKTPGHVYSNVLRIQYIENTTNVTEISGSKTTLNTRTINYLYFTPDTHAPLFSFATVQIRTTISIFGTVILDTTSSSRNISYLKNTALPLLFTSFNASVKNKQVLLNWQTAQEINTGGFNVQRSLNGSDFQDIAGMKATGNSSAINSYSYTDQDFVKSGLPASVYYRIKETDKDGQEFYSDIKVVHGSGSNISIYPNPVTNVINFNGANVAGNISIYDVKGHLIKQYSNYQLNQPLNIAGLSSGSYFIKIQTPDKTSTTTIIKQ